MQNAIPKGAAVAPGQLFIVATPIGNLGDLTQRAAQTLRTVRHVLAEDTRVTKRLLEHIGPGDDGYPRLTALHEHNESAQVDRVCGWLAEGQDIALVSDAGTPLISDPGFVLVRAVRAAGHAVVPVPGACALIAALSASGLPTDRFCFEGFLPAKAGTRQNKLQALRAEPRTLVFYEAPHRIAAMLADLAEVLGAKRHVVLAREVTKRFETIRAMPAAQLAQWVAQDSNQQRGEIVVLVAGADLQAEPESGAPVALDAVLETLLAELPLKQSVKLAAGITGAPRNVVYERALALRE